MQHLNKGELEAGLADILSAPKDNGTLSYIVQRPADGERIAIAAGNVNPSVGLEGDNWATRGSRMTDDGSSHPDMQLNIMNVRVAELVAQSEKRVPLAGDQLYVDFDLSEENLPIGSRLKIGAAEVEITAIPHLGCKKFVERFGRDAMEFVNSDQGKRLKLRGVNAKVLRAGSVQVGDAVTKLK